MAPLNELNFITGNKNKLAEVRAIIGSVINVENLSVDVPEIQGTIEEIAKEKCKRAAEVVSNRIIGSSWNCSLFASRIMCQYQWLMIGAGRGSCLDGGHSSRISCIERPPWSIHVGHSLSSSKASIWY